VLASSIVFSGFFSTLANTTDIINLMVDNYSKNNLEGTAHQSIMNKQEIPGSIMTLESNLYLTLLQGLSSLFRYGKDTAAVFILWTIILGPVVAILSTIPMTAVVFAAMYLTPLLDLSRIREWVFPEYTLPTPPIRF